jgi:hypothetical protein
VLRMNWLQAILLQHPKWPNYLLQQRCCLLQ